jgi:hypothetical protein
MIRQKAGGQGTTAAMGMMTNMFRKGNADPPSELLLSIRIRIGANSNIFL